MSPARPEPRPPLDLAVMLRDRYLHLTRHALPAAARTSAAAGDPWPVHFDHCFMRIVLDNLFGCRWDTVLNRRLGPAYRQLSTGQLAAGIALAESMLTRGANRVRELNDRSLLLRTGDPSPVIRRAVQSSSGP